MMRLTCSGERSLQACNWPKSHSRHGLSSHAQPAWFTGKPDFIQSTAFRNSSIQGGYFIIAARAVGLDCGPMSGFDNAKVDAEFFAGTPVKSNFICNLGHGDASKLFPRSPRLSFEEVCSLV